MTLNIIYTISITYEGCETSELLGTAVLDIVSVQAGGILLLVSDLAQPKVCTSSSIKSSRNPDEFSTPANKNDKTNNIRRIA